MAAAGVLVTLALCIGLHTDHRNGMLQGYYIGVWSVEPHLWLGIKYVISFVELSCVIRLCRTTSTKLLPGGHGHSTLAIYGFHWMFADVYNGKWPFVQDKWTSARSPAHAVLAELPPIPALILSHLVVYLVCLLLGQKALWRVVRHVSNPSCSWLLKERAIAPPMNE